MINNNNVELVFYDHDKLSYELNLDHTHKHNIIYKLLVINILSI